MAHFLDAVTSAQMSERIGQLIAADANLRVVNYLLGAPGMLAWAHSVGVATDEALADCVPPLPSAALRSIVADRRIAPFLYTGFMDAEYAAGLFGQYAAEPPGRPAVLDFGCGCGRMIRFFAPESWHVHGSEINRAHVDWCNVNLPWADVRENGYEPPLPFEDAQFDFVYTLSVFSHLSRERGAAWLKELGRILKPGGLAMVTTHGYTALETIRTSAEHQKMFRLDAAGTGAIVDGLAEAGVIYLPYDVEVIEAAHAGPSYGNTFIDPGYAARAWQNDAFDVAASVAGGLRGWQDVYVLRRR